MRTVLSRKHQHLPSRYEPVGRLNAICPYYTVFPLDFPYRQLVKASPKDWVLDPFCGRGTTNFAARLLGLPSVGIDSNPVAVAIAEAKLTHPTPAGIAALCRFDIVCQETTYRCAEGAVLGIGLPPTNFTGDL